MNLFAKTPAVETTPTNARSRFQAVLDDLTVAHDRLDHAAHCFSTLIFDIEKATKFINKFRVDLTAAIEETGNAAVVDGEGVPIEEQIKNYIPKRDGAALAS